MKPPIKFYLRGPHHGYVGIAFIIFGSVFLWLNWGNNLDFLNPWFLAIALIGVSFMIDDLIEHTLTEMTFLRWVWNKLMGIRK